MKLSDSVKVKNHFDGSVDIIGMLFGLGCQNASLSSTMISCFMYPVVSVDCERFFPPPKEFTDCK
ncbi:UNVERIFIED_CONTAM: hypothetical protein FKN15_051611 [Acipenser sinensis]